MHKVQIYDDIYQLPADWDDLTPAELLYLVKLTQTDIPIETVKVHMLLYSLKAHVTRHRKIYGDKYRISVGKESENVCFCVRRKKYLLSPEEVCSLTDLFHFLFERENDRYGNAIRHYIKPLRFVNPYPAIRIRMRKFTGPDDGLFDITFEQFMYMQTYLDAMQQEPLKINHLLACLWHRGKTFDINRLDDDAAFIRHLPEAKKMVMYWFITGCMINLTGSFPRVFSGGKGTVKHNVFDSQLRLLDTLANSDMTKKDAVRKGLLVDALYTMDESVRRQEEMEEKFKKH
ncbi:hypothetical protein [Bacteroides sp. UBA939]|uniref:hypothetical protein n=1 Tax=Bacteroides sp. UBA939 TaxID=1946092 RepID=UPI0025C4B444|nr:hypothetical protein [Bacteroides sp. UBA939]